MSDHCHSNPTMPATPDVGGHDLSTSSGEGTSRREFLKSSAALVAGGAAAEMRADSALAQAPERPMPSSPACRGSAASCSKAASC